MSPVILRVWNLRIVIHTKDHQPAHVHVIGPDGEARFAIGSWEVLSNKGFSERALKRIENFLRPRENEILEAWNEFHKEEN